MLSPGTPECIERYLRNLRGVVSARVLGEKDGGIREVRVLVVPGRSGAQIVKDIESVIAARLGIAVDPRKVSVIQLREEVEGLREPRLKINKISVESRGSWGRAEVELIRGEDRFVGNSEGSTASWLRIAADATLSAVKSAVGLVIPMYVEDVVLAELGRSRAVLVGVTMTLPVEERLIGSCVVAGDEIGAAVKATLDAVNRRLILVGG